MRRISSQAIVLARRNYAETDRILTVFSLSRGKLTLLAKGVRGITSRKRGHVEIFNLISFLAAKGRSMDLLTEVQVLDSFAGVRNDLRKAAVAFFLVDAVGRVTREEEKHPQVFDLLLGTLKKLEDSPDLKSLRHDFTRELLVLLGFWPKGRPLTNPDIVLEDVVEKEIPSIRVGKRVVARV